MKRLALINLVSLFVLVFTSSIVFAEPFSSKGKDLTSNNLVYQTVIARDNQEDIYEEGPDMEYNRMGHHQVTLPDGRIALFGGHGTRFTSLATAEIYDPETNSFTTYEMQSRHDQPGFTILNDGRYLISGGSADLGIPRYAESEIFNPRDNSFTKVGDMNLFRANSGSTTLKNGKVLIVGAWYYHNDAHTYGELFDPETGTFTQTSAFNKPRTEPVVIPLNDGRALIFGGRSHGTGTFFNPPVEIFDPETGEITIKQEMMILGNPDWYLIPFGSISQLQLLPNGRYIYITFKQVEDYLTYKLITADPETGEIEFFETSELPTSHEYSFIYHPIINVEKNLAYLIAFKTGADYKGLTLFTVDLESGNIYTTGEAIQLDYYCAAMGFSLTNDGRIFVTGGSTHNDYYTNFNPVNKTFFITPATFTAVDKPELQSTNTILRGNYPNPFNPTTTIEFALDEPTEVTIEIYNARGQKIRTLTTGSYQTGVHHTEWDGRDDRGREVVSGIYLTKLSTHKQVSTKKMIMLK